MRPKHEITIFSMSIKVSTNPKNAPQQQHPARHKTQPNHINKPEPGKIESNLRAEKILLTYTTYQICGNKSPDITRPPWPD